MKKEKNVNIVWTGLTLICAILLSLSLLGCKTMYVPMESMHTEYRDRTVHDSIYLHDSVYIRERGDTVLVDRWHTKYVERLRVDSFCRIDSVPAPYPVEVVKEVEKELSWWQGVKMDAGGLGIGALLLVFVYHAVKLFKLIKTGGWGALWKMIIGK